VFRFIVEYTSLMDFGPLVIGLFLYEDFWKMIFWLVLKLEISYRVIISWRILVSFRGNFLRLYFCMMKYLTFHNSCFALRSFLMYMARPQCVTPLCYNMFPYLSMKQGSLFCFVCHDEISQTMRLHVGLLVSLDKFQWVRVHQFDLRLFRAMLWSYWLSNHFLNEI
jgi:hypothetical protein